MPIALLVAPTANHMPPEGPGRRSAASAGSPRCGGAQGREGCRLQTLEPLLIESQGVASRTIRCSRHRPFQFARTFQCVDVVCERVRPSWLRAHNCFE